jgi:LPXTG-motif cell wall-anchored protein
MQYSVSYQGEGNYTGDYTDYVWVKNLEIPTPDPGPGTIPDPGPGPTPNPNPSIPGTGDFDTLLASLLALFLVIMGAGALVVSRRKVARAKH